MNITIQPLTSKGALTGVAVLTTFIAFLEANDGLPLSLAAEIHATLKMGSAYRLGGGAAGEYRIAPVQ